jgi:hypothetical protein
MRLRYQTAIATIIQFVSITILNIATGLNSVITTCSNKNTSSDCTSNLLVSLIFFLLTAGWFAAIWALGFASQSKRSRQLARLLIIVELGVALVALFNIKHHTDILSLITSIIDLSLSVWVMYLAYNLSKAKGGRLSTAASKSIKRAERSASRSTDGHRAKS